MNFQDGLIDKFLASRVCARCYGELWKRPAEGRLWEPYCPTCEGMWNGATISIYTAERRGQQAIAELWEVKKNLADLFPNPHKGKSVKELFGY